MIGPSLSRDAGCRLASYIEDRRGSLVASVIRSSVLPRPGSVAATAFTNAFLDHLCRELESGDGDGLNAWADTISAPAETFEHVRLVMIACSVISVAYGADSPKSDEVIAYLALRSRELEKCFRTERTPQRIGSLIDTANLVSRDEVVAALLSAIDARDPATCDHSRAVGMWSGRIAKTLEMSAEEQAFAALAGTLHDVGKIAVPTTILLKAGPLDSQEWREMRAHAEVGGKMLERIPCLKEYAPSVRAHHERIDGRGYPDRLNGEAIPMVSRIVAVADSFHAMISKRSYRDPLPVPLALEELRGGVGTQWDTDVTYAMLRIMQPAGAQRTLRVASRGAA